MALHFADPEFFYYWAANSGDVVFWKVPVKLFEEHGQKIEDAFASDRFGDEWGSLSSHSIRTLDLETLKLISSDEEPDTIAP
jgi:hypothetical protein